MSLGSEAEAPSLQILTQNAVAHEKFSKGGVQKQVHVVVKNIVFTVELASSFELSRAQLEAKLIYDYDRDDQEIVDVPYVKSEPIDSKMIIVESYKAVSEIRIKVLTSQHEDMLFRVKFTASDKSNAPFAECCTQPIKVISKITQIKKETSGEVSMTSNPSPVSRKNKLSHSASLAIPAAGDSINEILSRIDTIQRQQDDQSKLLNFIASKFDPESTVVQTGSVYEGGLNESMEPQDEFETSAIKFLNLFEETPAEERIEKLRSVISRNPSVESTLSNLLHSLTELPQKRAKVEQ
eukprot:TRINITY_DN1232_c0_g1_i1.p1 TRINITY_DN1232_c0_g1~~TRINITY_DN1232_c0_g1_i1.p1  ORF type:complete len:295 (+),score=120.20 TRINITY_DN1232_c0_g1_i1:205-1089(+)